MLIMQMNQTKGYVFHKGLPVWHKGRPFILIFIELIIKILFKMYCVLVVRHYANL